MLIPFQTKNTKTKFYLDNKRSVLYDKNKQPLFQPLNDSHTEFDRFGCTSKQINPEMIKIILGHGCNYSCGYCMQKDIGNPTERPSNLFTTTLINNIKRLDITELSRIELWGGETLLYWKDIIQLMTELDNENITWYIPTNGTLLKHKHLDFLMTLKGNVAIGISHDGPGHKQLRGPDFLHRKVDVFNRIQQECFPKIQFSFNPVISNTNFDLFAINDFFSDYFSNNKLQPVTLSYELGRVYDKTISQNSTLHVISSENKQKYQQILQSYLNQHIIQFKQQGFIKHGKLLANSLFHTGMGVIPYAKLLKYNKIPMLKSNCGADDSRLLTMDMTGNVRTCQNVDEQYNSGHITKVIDVSSIGMDLDRDWFCDSCSVNRLCKSSCPLDLGQEAFKINHSIEQIHYNEIQMAAFKLLFDDEIIAI